jgi:hypothetical protein
MTDEQRENLIAVWSSVNEQRTRGFLATLDRSELIETVCFLLKSLRTVPLPFTTLGIESDSTDKT